MCVSLCRLSKRNRLNLTRIWHDVKFDYLLCSLGERHLRAAQYIGCMRPGCVGGNTACVLLCNETSCAMLLPLLCLEKILDMRKSRPLGAQQEKKKRVTGNKRVSVANSTSIK